MANHRNLNDLLAWQKSMDLAVYVCKEIVPALPKTEKFSLCEQLQRAAQSIPANIAEGFGRYHYQDTIRFCYIARGSLTETYSHITFAHRMGYLDDDRYDPLVEQMQETHRIINSYITFLKQSKLGENEPGYPIREQPSEYDRNNLGLEYGEPDDTSPLH